MYTILLQDLFNLNLPIKIIYNSPYPFEKILFINHRSFNQYKLIGQIYNPPFK